MRTLRVGSTPRHCLRSQERLDLLRKQGLLAGLRIRYWWKTSTDMELLSERLRQAERSLTSCTQRHLQTRWRPLLLCSGPRAFWRLLSQNATWKMRLSRGSQPSLTKVFWTVHTRKDANDRSDHADAGILGATVTAFVLLFCIIARTCSQALLAHEPCLSRASTWQTGSS
ncbi:hypothetical protein HBI64_119100 [Parastagonospora nodorum]|nr:hypothetical protein HBI79_208800 [Parastagonospora nodorum]KAH6128764.1 hypothetical protein HBI64_119100 [Parastagonospora nodorum]